MGNEPSSELFGNVASGDGHGIAALCRSEKREVQWAIAENITVEM